MPKTAKKTEALNESWTCLSIKKTLQNLVFAKGYLLIELTSKIDSALPSTELSRWMDTIGGHVGGWFHRAKHGHDFAANIKDVYTHFGLSGVLKYPFELARDATTQHGIPLPGSEFLVKYRLVDVMRATHWLSLNVADIFTGAIAIYSTYKLYKNTRNKKIDTLSLVWANIGIGVKMTSGLASTNLILVLSGLADTAILLKKTVDLKRLRRFLSPVLKVQPAVC